MAPPSIITTGLHRHGLIAPEVSAAAEAWRRFELHQPNALWQIDFKGDFGMARSRCYPLTVLDDHSRFNLALAACPNVSAAAVRPHLTTVFRR